MPPPIRGGGIIICTQVVGYQKLFSFSRLRPQSLESISLTHNISLLGSGDLQTLPSDLWRSRECGPSFVLCMLGTRYLPRPWLTLTSCIGGRPPRYAPASPPRGRRSALRRRADGNVAAVSQHVPTPNTANTFPRPPLQPPDAPTRR